MYRAGWIGKEIVRVDIEKETAVFVKISGQSIKQSKLTEYRGFFNSYEEAKAWLKDRLSREIESLESAIEYRKKELEKLMMLSE